MLLPESFVQTQHHHITEEALCTWIGLWSMVSNVLWAMIRSIFSLCFFWQNKPFFHSLPPCHNITSHFKLRCCWMLKYLFTIFVFWKLSCFQLSWCGSCTRIHCVLESSLKKLKLCCNALISKWLLEWLNAELILQRLAAVLCSCNSYC